MKNNIKQGVLYSLFFVYSFGYSQGCSDAGICSIGKPFEDVEINYKNSFDLSTIYAAGEADVTYFTQYLTYNHIYNDKFSLTSKVTFSNASGSFGKRGAFGDGFLIGNYNFNEVNSNQWSAILGFKFPFSISNDKINNYSLPLDYQASLGTFDLFLGTNFNFKQWSFNTIIQLPIYNLNKNSFIKEFSGTNDFPTTNLFVRKPDALFKTSYKIIKNKSKIQIIPELLFIYHLGKDTYEDVFGKRQNINGSEGITINGNIQFAYRFNPTNSISLSAASPFLVREVRPDGLTRKFVINLNYKIKF